MKWTRACFGLRNATRTRMKQADGVYRVLFHCELASRRGFDVSSRSECRSMTANSSARHLCLPWGFILAPNPETNEMFHILSISKSGLEKCAWAAQMSTYSVDCNDALHSDSLSNLSKLWRSVSYSFGSKLINAAALNWVYHTVTYGVCSYTNHLFKPAHTLICIQQVQWLVLPSWNGESVVQFYI